MQNLSNIGVIKDLLRRYGFTFSKGLGQNFLINPTVCPRIAELGGARPGTGVIEVGAGIGVLTAELARRADRVVCIEIDHRLLPILDETLQEFSNISIVNEDVLKLDLRRLIEERFDGMPVTLCANLPYYITSPIIMKLLEDRLPIESITVMVQKEVAQRLCAAPGEKGAGAISVAVHYYAQPHLLFHVSRGSFLPAPSVDSSVIRLDVLGRPAIEVRDEAFFFQMVKAAFSQRRKTLVNALAGTLPVDKAALTALAGRLGLPAACRAEELSLQQLGQVADGMAGLMGEIPADLEQ